MTWAKSIGPNIMAQIPVFVINLARRPDRLARIAEHLGARAITFSVQPACDARSTPEAEIAGLVKSQGPLGRLGLGDRACTVSHMRAWRQFLQGGASHALFLEDDVYLAQDTAALLADTGWIAPGLDAIKLEKYGDGTSRLLLGACVGATPTGRAVRPMLSRHVGGAAYILSRRGAEIALAAGGRIRVPIDHLLFNANVSAVARRLRPAVIVPAMATQRAYDYDSDISQLGKAARPKGWRLILRHLKRGYYEIRLAPRQLWALATGRGQLVDLHWQEAVQDQPPAQGDQ